MTVVDRRGVWVQYDTICEEPKPQPQCTTPWQIALAPKLNHQRERPKRKTRRDEATHLPWPPPTTPSHGHPWSTLHLAHPFACRPVMWQQLTQKRQNGGEVIKGGSKGQEGFRRGWRGQENKRVVGERRRGVTCGFVQQLQLFEGEIFAEIEFADHLRPPPWTTAPGSTSHRPPPLSIATLLHFLSNLSSFALRLSQMTDVTRVPSRGLSLQGTERKSWFQIITNHKL